MPPSPNPAFSPAAYANMKGSARIRLLFEHLEDLSERLCWIDDELARYGFCAICNMIGGATVEHDCCERQR